MIITIIITTVSIIIMITIISVITIIVIAVTLIASMSYSVIPTKKKIWTKRTNGHCPKC